MCGIFSWRRIEKIALGSVSYTHLDVYKRQLHGLRGGAKRSGLLDGMQQTARSLTEKALAVLIKQRHADIWLHGGSFPTTFSFPLYFDIHNGIIADFVVK